MALRSALPSRMVSCVSDMFLRTLERCVFVRAISCAHYAHDGRNPSTSFFKKVLLFDKTFICVHVVRTGFAMKIKKNTSLSGEIVSLGEKIMKVKHCDDFSEFVSSLIREEADRRGLISAGGDDALAESPISYSAKAGAAGAANKPVVAPVLDAVLAEAGDKPARRAGAAASKGAGSKRTSPKISETKSKTKSAY